ncbi:hypothetical protein TVAG_433240 [Trichomonas vaginalis G3]|uniref:EF-hand domain-containing protein n=1 Tax=Trichomonas vaginalis (strain ATCC PRA-98 / G3) TaxID=412133 RepID=A2DIW5_TRIV3|nr:armadillo (ARM) repeat-containing protein family [Trichomonas vaginalis G3]EAY19728.1 hypothetical protein TVAG_433240 [Trichomonas vaginalis G3]KAI5521252.1 armadillo (ARM) repeat-containing protein family [Trichomonas vaginalis G3]|eukprot:XP_001580714.1 hypothetical protein [Trichomonas vaginalis G3]
MFDQDDDDKLDPQEVEKIIRELMDPVAGQKPENVMAMEKLFQHPDFPDTLKSIIMKTSSPAILQMGILLLERSFKSNWKKFSLNRKKIFMKFFIDMLKNEVVIENRSFYLICKSIGSIVQRTKTIYPELMKFLFELPQDFNTQPEFIARLLCLNECIPFLEKQQFFANLNTILSILYYGMEIEDGIITLVTFLKKILQIHGDIENIILQNQQLAEEINGYEQTEETEAKLQEISTIITNESSNLEIIQNSLQSDMFLQTCQRTGDAQNYVYNSTTCLSYFEAKMLISKILQVSEPIQDAISAASSQDMDISQQYEAFGVIISYLQDQNLLQEILNYIYTNIPEIEVFEDIYSLPFIEEALKSFQHALVASFLTNLIQICLQNPQESIVLCLMSFTELVTNAPEVFTKELTDLVDKSVEIAFSYGEMTNSKLYKLIQAVYDQDQSSLKSILIKYLDNLINSFNSDKSQDTLLAISTLLNYNLQIKEESQPLIWEMRHSIDNFTQEIYLDILKKTIEKREKIETSFANDILLYVSPAFEESETLAGSALLVCASILRKEEKVEEIIQNCVPILHQLFSVEDETRPVQDALTFIATACEIMRENATFVTDFFENIQNILESSNVSSELYNEAVRTACFTIRYCGNEDVVSLVFDILDKQLSSNSDSMLIDSLLNIKLITKFIEEDSAIILYNKISSHARETTSVEILTRCFDSLSRFAKFFGSSVVDDCFELFELFIHGKLPASSSTFESFCDFDMELLDSFTEFCYRVVSINSDVAEQICSEYIHLSERHNETYSMMITRVFTGSLESETCTENIVHTYLDIIGDIIESSTPNLSQQEIVYALNLILNKFPGNVSLVTSHLDLYLRWWHFVLENKSSYINLASNLASLFLTVASTEENFPLDVLDQSLLFFPPSDTTECRRMSISLLNIITRGEIPAQIQVSLSRCLSLLFTMPQTEFRKLKLDQDLINTLVSVLKQLVTKESNLNSALDSVKGSDVMTNKLYNIINS